MTILQSSHDRVTPDFIYPGPVGTQIIHIHIARDDDLVVERLCRIK
jgi:hypothetical protein